MDKELLDKVITLARNYHVKKLIQFGSSLDSLENSKDVDFACDGLYDKRFFRFGAELEEIFRKPVDLIPLFPPDKFTEYLLKNGIVIYESAS